MCISCELKKMGFYWFDFSLRNITEKLLKVKKRFIGESSTKKLKEVNGREREREKWERQRVRNMREREESETGDREK